MIADIRKLLDVVPFVPFSIVTSSGKHYRVATPDHASFNPNGTRVIVYFDDDSHVAIAPLHISSIEQETPAG
jgi:hypothetical protein